MESDKKCIEDIGVDNEYMLTLIKQLRKDIDNIHGFLVWIDKNVSFNAIVHESTHVAFETFRDIGGIADEDNQEPFAYLIGWVAGQIKNV